MTALARGTVGGLVTGAMLVVAAAFHPWFIAGCGTTLSLITALLSLQLVRATFPASYYADTYTRALLVAGVINAVLFALGYVIIARVLRRLRPIWLGVALGAWTAFYLASMLLLFPASDCP
jgi:uncharacterized membrane protein YagU involved in acid resistance